MFTGLLHHLKVKPIFIHEKRPSGRRLIDVFTRNVTSLKRSLCFVCVKMTCDSVCVCLFFPLRYISYPRTETNIFPQTLALGPLVEQQIQSPNWGTFAQRVLDQPGGPNPRQGKKSDQAHPPIHPTKYSNTLQVGLQELCANVLFFPS